MESDKPSKETKEDGLESKTHYTVGKGNNEKCYVVVEDKERQIPCDFYYKNFLGQDRPKQDLGGKCYVSNNGIIEEVPCEYVNHLKDIEKQMQMKDITKDMQGLDFDEEDKEESTEENTEENKEENKEEKKEENEEEKEENSEKK